MVSVITQRKWTQHCSSTSTVIVLLLLIALTLLGLSVCAHKFEVIFYDVVKYLHLKLFTVNNNLLVLFIFLRCIMKFVVKVQNNEEEESASNPDSLTEDPDYIPMNAEVKHRQVESHTNLSDY